MTDTREKTGSKRLREANTDVKGQGGTLEFLILDTLQQGRIALDLGSCVLCYHVKETLDVAEKVNLQFEVIWHLDPAADHII